MGLVCPVIVSKKDDPEKTGIMVMCELVSTIENNEQGQPFTKTTSVAGVLWDDERSPAINFCDPSELTWEDILYKVDDEEEEEESNTPEMQDMTKQNTVDNQG